MKYVIHSETPSKKNSRINTRSGRSFPSKAFQNWERGALLELKAQGLPTLIDEPIFLSVEFFHADNRRRDSDNQLSSVLDLLMDGGILKDDCWQIVRKISVENYHTEVKGESKAIIQITKLWKSKNEN